MVEMGFAIDLPEYPDADYLHLENLHLERNSVGDLRSPRSLKISNHSYMAGMKTIYFTANYIIQLFFTCVFGIQIKELYLKPKKKELS